MRPENPTCCLEPDYIYLGVEAGHDIYERPILVELWGCGSCGHEDVTFFKPNPQYVAKDDE